MIDSFECNPRTLWKAVNDMLQLPQQRSFKLSADDFATFFQDKVAGMRRLHPPVNPVITQRQAPQFSRFEPVTVSEIQKLIMTTPAKSCALDPIPIWLLKQMMTSIAPVVCHLCNLSLQTGTFPMVLKHACVIPLLKKPALDPDATNSYRPISNLSYLSKVVERVVDRRFNTQVSILFASSAGSTVSLPPVPLYGDSCSVGSQ